MPRFGLLVNFEALQPYSFKPEIHTKILFVGGDQKPKFQRHSHEVKAMGLVWQQCKDPQPTITNGANVQSKL